MSFKVYDLDGNDVTDDHQWFIDQLGCLYIFVNDSLRNVEDDYWYAPE